jgi:predicted Zn-dependent peptidase|uniref:Peptidase M16 N-terminal domain-containing protein n=1 Tax=Globisporangium ultimum (strain ATCC 200006 / CBS 805.95 / DAOM BR144) TaxID=431595 RepID=K3WRH0_GLOUD
MLARSQVHKCVSRAASRSFFKSANVGGAQVAVDEEFPGLPATHPAAPKTPTTEVSTTASGIKIASDNASPYVTLAVQLAAGSRVETDETAGISQLFSKMAFRATEARSDLKLYRDIEAIGGVINKDAGRDFVRYSISVLPEHTDAAAQILAETTLAPRFAHWDIAIQKDQVKAELEKLTSNPAALLLEGVHTAAYYDDATLGRPIITTENLAKFDTEELVQFYKKYVNTSGAALLGAGIEHSDLTEIANAYFSELPVGAPIDRTPAKYVGGESRVKTSSPVTHVAIGFETVGKRDPHYGAARVLRALLAGRVNPKHATAFFGSYNDSGVVGLSGHAANTNVGALAESFIAEIKSLATTPVSAEELAVAKTVAALNAYESLGSREGVLVRLGLLGLHQVPAPSPLELADSATPQAIQQLAQKALTSRPSVASIGKVSAVPRVDAVIAKLK